MVRPFSSNSAATCRQVCSLVTWVRYGPMLMSKTRSLIVLFVCLLLVRSAAASTVKYLTDAQLIALSERVAHARVISQRTTWDGPERHRIYTVTTLAVIEDFTGQPGNTIEVWELGGRVGDDVMYVGGAVKFTVGTDVLVCLERGPRGLRNVAMNLSKFDVVVGVQGGVQLQRDLRDTNVVGGAAAAPRTLQSFRQLAATVTGRASIRYQAPQGAALRLEDSFTKLGGEPGIRWREADTATPVTYYRNTAAASPLVSGDSTAEIQASLAAWTNLASAAITLQFGGTTAQADPHGPWGALPGPVGVISYEDPSNEISGSTLAIGGGFGTAGNGGTINGTVFDRFTSAYVIFQNAANLDTSFKQSLNFSRVMTHEIGHTIGLGHTQQDGSIANATSNIMYATCCATDTPTPPAVGLDDTAGAAFFYPVGRTDGCTYALAPQTATASAGGGAASATLTTQTGCSWSTISNSSHITLNSAASGTGSTTIQYSVAANASTNPRLGSLTVTGQSLTVTQAGAAGPTMALDKSALYYGATLSGAAVTFQTSSQIVRMTQANAGTVTWTATPSQPWIQVSPASGTGSALLSISVVPTGLTLGSFNGTVTITLSGTTSTVGPISVGLTTIAHGTSLIPTGTVDTPLNNATGVFGAVPFTGWAVDDIEVTRVSLCRAGFGTEVAPVDPNCGGAAQIYVGDAVFIDGARPDVQGIFPGVPRNTRAGWGFMVLTNMLPAQGNGTYTFYNHAFDREGRTFLLGARTITISNATAVKPFGFIDTPAQGGVTSTSNYVNFGWALTQASKIIPPDGSTIFVIVDGASVGNADYGHFRPDIAGTFPGLQNSNGAVGFRILDTTAMANGLHTISWTVTDSGGQVEGIGSRFFTVSNGVGALTAAPGELALSPHAANDNGRAAADTATVAVTARDQTPILGRRGWDLNAPWRAFGIGSSGRAVIRGEEVDRFELWLGEHSGSQYRGYVRVGEALAPLPVGSLLNPTTGWFTWAPGVGFIGTYDLVFVRWAGDRAVARHDVRFILAPKGSGYTGVQAVIDTPRNDASVEQPFMLGGWAVDLDAGYGTGIETLHAWAYPLAGGPPVFLGAMERGPRPDVAAIHGDRFRNAGFGVIVQSLPSGSYDLAVFPWSNVIGGFTPPKTVRIVIP